MMRALIKDLYPRYSEATKTKKGEMAWEVTRELKKTCRFLKQNPDGFWVAVSDEEAQKKVSMTFRKPETGLASHTILSTAPTTNKMAPTTHQPAKKMRTSPETVNTEPTTQPTLRFFPVNSVEQSYIFTGIS